MKKMRSIKNAVTIVSVGIISLFFMNITYAANVGKVNTETVNLREKTDGSSKILELLPNNKEVEIIEKTGDWYQVKVDGMTGYVRQDLITVQEQPEENTTTETETQETQAPVEQQPAEAPAEEVKEEVTENKEQEVVEEKEIELGKYKVTENTKLKILPVINATNAMELKENEEVNVTEIMNGWVCVETATAKGWIRKEKLQKEEPKAEPVEEAKPEEQPKQAEPEPEPEKVIKKLYINTTSVNLRKEANTSSEILANLLLNTSVDVLSEANGWSKVRVNGKEGYISTSLLSDRKQETSRSESTPRTAEKKEEKKQETPPAPSKNGASVVAYAKQFIGTKYTYGGSSPSTGFDCSGFTSYVYKNFGVSLPRTSGGQAGVGTKVDRSNLAAGDLVVYSGHVAIYVGGGQVIHAPRPGKSVCIVPLNQAASNYITARRVF